MIKDYYKILEIEENFTEDVLKKKYRELSKKYHPDINPSGGDKFKDISEAYDVLSDANKRRQYDIEKQGGFGGNDIFANFFNQAHRQHKPVDKMVTLKLTPIEIYKGAAKDIVYSKNNPCDVCKGSCGTKKTCETCNGGGFIINRFGSGFFVQQVQTTCPTCAGLGQMIIDKCYKCNGVGVKSEMNKVTIEVPRTADNGQFLKMHKLGDFDKYDFGDLVLRIEVIDSDGFSKVGNDLVYTHFLNENQICDDKYIVPHPSGDLSIKALEVFDTSKPLRIKDKGYPRGDFYVKLEVKFKK
jgi:molecular chaperone DnaJ